MLLLSPLWFILLATTAIVSVPVLLLTFPDKLSIPREWAGSEIQRSELQQPFQTLTKVGESRTPTHSNAADVKVPRNSNRHSSNSENKIESAATNLTNKKNSSERENRHGIAYWLQIQDSSSVKSRFSSIGSYKMRRRHALGRVAYGKPFRTDHSQPTNHALMFRRQSHDLISRFIPSYDNQKTHRKKSVYQNKKLVLNSASYQRDMETSKNSMLETSEQFVFQDSQNSSHDSWNHEMSDSSHNFAGIPTTTSLRSEETSENGPALSVFNYLKSTGARSLAAAPCRSTRFWLPTVLRMLEREGFRLVFYCIDGDLSESESQKVRNAFSGLSSLKFGGFITTNLEYIEDVMPRNLDVVISWFGIQSWRVRKALRFVKGLQRSGVKRAVFTSMCSNPNDAMDKPWTESESRVTSFWGRKVSEVRRRSLNECSQMVVHSLI